MASRVEALDDRALNLIFRRDRTHNAWQNRPVSEETIRVVYDLAGMGPTSANACPARFVFLRSEEAKAKLGPHLYPGNVDKAMRAPCCIIVAYDTQFYDLLPQLFPSRDLRAAFVGKPGLIEDTAQRNSSLQGAYFIVAARALGLDCGPMSGFNKEAL